MINALLGGAATCSEGFVICLLKVRLACLGSMAAAVQPRYKRYQSQTGFKERNFCHPQTEIFLKTSPKWEQLDQSDCLLWSAYEVWPIRSSVLLSLCSFRVTQALLLHDSYLSIWARPRTTVSRSPPRARSDCLPPASPSVPAALRTFVRTGWW